MLLSSSLDLQCAKYTTEEYDFRLCNSAMDIHIAIANAWHTLTTKRFPSDDLNDVKVLHCVTEEGKEFQTEHVLGTKE